LLGRSLLLGLELPLLPWRLTIRSSARPGLSHRRHPLLGQLLGVLRRVFERLHVVAENVHRHRETALLDCRTVFDALGEELGGVLLHLDRLLQRVREEPLGSLSVRRS
jgi:hypothetical protein